LPRFLQSRHFRGSLLSAITAQLDARSVDGSDFRAFFIRTALAGNDDSNGKYKNSSRRGQGRRVPATCASAGIALQPSNLSGRVWPWKGVVRKDF
jgi:hypothetical protein